MSKYKYKEGQRLAWIQPEAGMSAIGISQEVWKGGPVAHEIVVVMEPGLHCDIPHFAVISNEEVVRKYSAHLCFSSGPVLGEQEGMGDE